MKLAHLLEYEFPKIRTQQKKRLPYQYHHAAGDAHGIYNDDFSWDGSDPQVLRRRKTIHMGSGVFGSTYQHKDRPHDVRKVSRRQKFHTVDGYYYFLKELENSPHNGNPYFPRFRDIKIYSTPGDKEMVYSVSMERLFPLHVLRSEERLAGLTRIFGTDHIEEALELLDSPPTRITPVDVTYVFEDAMSGLKGPLGIDLNSLEKEFREAVKFVREVAEYHEFHVDLHDENIMCRRGPTGAHFVITDPFSYN